MSRKTHFLGLFLILTWQLPLEAATPSPVLLAPLDQNFRKPDEPVVLEFPFDIINNISTQLALEIDNIDISALVEIDEALVIYTPPSPLTPGMHQMRLVEYAHNGDIVELGNWRFEIRQSAAFQSQQMQLSASLNNNLLVANDYSPQDRDIDSPVSNGAAEMTYQARNESNGVYFRGSLIHDQIAENTPGGKKLDLGDFVLQMDLNQRTRLNAGHHQIDYSSLIYRDFNRRGVSGSVAVPELNTSVQLFSARNGDLSGFSGGLGISDADNRSDGIVVKFQPFSHNPQMLTISTGYLSGAQTGMDDSQGYLFEESSGSARSIAFDSQLLDHRLRLYLEAAQSQFDFDGEQASAASLKDNAYQFVTQYSGLPIGDGIEPWQWSIALEKLIVEPNFHVLTNQQLSADVDYSNLSANISKGAWSSQLFYKTERDNLDHRYNATNNFDTTGLDLSYTGYRQDLNSSLDSWNYRWLYQLTQHSQQGVKLDTASTPLAKNDNLSEFVQLSAAFGYPLGNWYLTLSQNTFTDDSGLQPDSLTRGAEIGSDITLNDQHTLTASLNYYDTTEDDSSLNNQSLAYHFGLESSFSPVAITTSLSIDYDQADDNQSNELAVDQNQLAVNAIIARKFRQAHGVSPGIDVQLRASYFDLKSNLSSDQDSSFYEVFVDLNIYWDGQSSQPQPTNEENWQ